MLGGRGGSAARDFKGGGWRPWRGLAAGRLREELQRANGGGGVQWRLLMLLGLGGSAIYRLGRNIAPGPRQWRQWSRVLVSWRLRAAFQRAREGWRGSRGHRSTRTWRWRRRSSASRGGRIGHAAERRSAHSARPERDYGVSSMQGVRVFVAKRVQGVVPRLLITGVQLDGQKEHCGDLWIRDKIDVAILWQKLCSHGVVWDGESLSSGLWVQRTTTLWSLGSNRPMYMVLAL